MIIEKPASTVRAKAKRDGYLHAIVTRTGRSAARAELDYVPENHCSVRIAVAAPGVEDWLSQLSEVHA